MNTAGGRRCLGTRRMVVLSAVSAFFLLAGCTTPTRTFDPEVEGPQLLVAPESVSLGVAALTGTRITFRGKGFDPEDSVFIQLMGVKKGDKEVDLPVAEAEVGQDGGFEAQMTALVKVSEILNAKIGSNEKMENVIVVSQPPIEAKTYIARAVSMVSEKTALCRLTLREPSVGDRFKDWLGGVMGKIEKK